jgi:alkyldihydroxyacetonephosphate synthase
MPWNGWGPPIELPGPIRQLLDGLGVPARDLPGVAEAEVALPLANLPAEPMAALTGILGRDGVDQSDRARLRHAAGRSASDLVRLRAGRIPHAPDAVLWPATHEQVLAVLQVCSEHRIAVVPFGGGTSVVGGVDPDRSGFAGVVTLDLHGLGRLVDLDPVSRTVTLQAGMSTPQAETALQSRGFTLGHYPQSFEHATIGGFAATRSTGQASSGYGRFDENVPTSASSSWVPKACSESSPTSPSGSVRGPRPWCTRPGPSRTSGPAPQPCERWPRPTACRPW